MKAIFLRICCVMGFIGAAGFLIYSDERILGVLVTVLTSGLLLIGFGALVALVWLAMRSLLRLLLAPPQQAAKPCGPAAARGESFSAAEP